MTWGWVLACLILLPLSAAAAAFAFPRSGRRVASVVAAVALGAVFWLAREVMARGVQVHRVGGWGAPLGIDLRADGLAVLMLVLTAFAGTAVAVYAGRYFEACEPGGTGGGAGMPAEGATGDCRRHFWPLFLFLWTALNALFLSADIFNLYVTLEVLGFAAVPLVALGGQRAALTAAMRYLFVSLSGSLSYLMGVGLVYGQCGTVDLPSLAAQAQAGPAIGVALALMSGGLVMKAALFPMHFWLPPAHANAPAPVSALLSALVVKGAFYILLRIWFEAFPALMTPVVGQVFGALGAAAIGWGAVNALFQSRLKLLVAYSTVAQLGYLFLIFPLAMTRAGGVSGWSGGLLLLASHALAKTAMFLAAGNIHHAAGHDRLGELRGWTHALPVSAFAFGLSALSLMGLPPSSGFAGKWLLLSAGLDQGQWWWVAVILVGSLLGAAYSVRVLVLAFTGGPEPGSFHPVPAVMEWTALVMALVAVGLGLVAVWPAELLRVGAPLTGAVLSGGGGP